MNLLIQFSPSLLPQEALIKKKKNIMKERNYRNSFLKICVLKRREPEEHTFAVFVNMGNQFILLPCPVHQALFFLLFLESHTKSVRLYLVRLLPQVSQCPQDTFEICSMSDCECEGE